MASALGMMGGGLFNALAFAGAGYMFKMIDKEGYLEETNRHNEAMEKLSEAKEKWYENEVAKKDAIARKRQELSDANADISATNKVLDVLRRVTYANKTFTREPHINDFYEPSSEMESYQHIAAGIVGLGAGWGGYKLIGTVI